MPTFRRKISSLTNMLIPHQEDMILSTMQKTIGNQWAKVNHCTHSATKKTIFTDIYSTQRTRRSQRHFLAARTTPSRTDSMRPAAHNLGKILETTKNPLIITTVTRIATQTQRKNLKSHLEGIRTWSQTVPRSR